MTDDHMTDEDALRLAAGEHLFRQECTFVKGVTGLKHLPEATQPEVAFCGRSNVGKSTLLNALTGRKSLARASNTPGRTREINYFDLAQKIWLVDLPGYGYAKVSNEQVKRWIKLTNSYLTGRPNLFRAFMLVDSRRGLGTADWEMIERFNVAAVSFQVVLTKADKPKKGELNDLVAKTTEALIRQPAAHPVVLQTSSEKGDGLAALRAEIAAFCAG